MSAPPSQQTADPLVHPLLHAAHIGMIGTDRSALGGRQVMADRVGQDEVAVGQPLHQRTGAQAIGAVIGKLASPITKSPGIVLIKL